MTYLRRRRDRGITILEIMIALGVLAVALIGLLSVIFFVTRLNQGNKENMIALRAAERIIETMQSTSFSDIFKNYNSVPGDDVPGPGSGPGEFFEVEMLPKVNPLDPLEVPEPALRRVSGNPTCGRIFFPQIGAALREDVTEADFPDGGMPRDLNGDGTIGSTPVNDDYVLLPVRVEVAWEGIQGPRILIYHHMFVRRD